MDKTVDTNSGDLDKQGLSGDNILWVSGDPENMSREEKSKAAKALAGAIINVLKRHGEVHLRCFGRRSLWKATKAMIVARTTAASYGTDIYFLPYFIEAVFNGQKQVGFGFTTVANTTPKWGSTE